MLILFPITLFGTKRKILGNVKASKKYPDEPNTVLVDNGLVTHGFVVMKKHERVFYFKVFVSRVETKFILKIDVNNDVALLLANQL